MIPPYIISANNCAPRFTLEIIPGQLSKLLAGKFITPIYSPLRFIFPPIDPREIPRLNLRINRLIIIPEAIGMGGGESEKNIDELISTNICELIFHFFFYLLYFALSL